MTPLADETSGITFIRPPAVGLVRGQRAALTCSASDQDGDILQYVWSASSGSLEASNAPEAILTAGQEDAGVSCTVLDGRGGVAASHRVIDVQDTYFAGATLVPGGALLSVAYGAEFDLVLWTPTGGVQIPQTGDQWLPRSSDTTVGYVDHASGIGVLVLGQLAPGADPPVTASQVTTGATAFAVTDFGIAWVDEMNVAHFHDLNGGQSTITSGLDPGLIAASADTVAVGRGGNTVELFRVDAGAPWLFDVILTPGRVNPYAEPEDGPNYTNPFATDGSRAIYWSWEEGSPMLATQVGETELGSEGIPTGSAGRLELSSDYAIYSFYESPLRFVEATVVQLSGDQPLGSERVAIGPSEVLDRDGDRLLLGRPRSNEAEPSADLWIVDLSTLEVVP